MASVKFQLLSESEPAPIYLRLSVKRGLSPRAKTGLYINPNQWSKSNHHYLNRPNLELHCKYLLF